MPKGKCRPFNVLLARWCRESVRFHQHTVVFTMDSKGSAEAALPFTAPACYDTILASG